MDKKDINLLSFVVRGKNRQDVLMCLNNKSLQRQADIAQKTKMYRTHVRRTLIELEKQKLVICLNPKQTQGKLYKITQKGEKILKEI